MCVHMYMCGEGYVSEYPPLSCARQISLQQVHESDLCVCTRICVYAHVYVCIHTYMCVCTRICVYAHVYVCMHTYLCVCTRICVYAHVSVCMHTYMCICTRICVCAHVRVCMHINMYGGGLLVCVSTP